MSFAGLTAVPLVVPVAQAATVAATYEAQGPGPITNGQVENVTPNNEVAGAVHTVVAHPTDPNIMWVGTVNGGIWRTNNATAVSPNWVPLTDNQLSPSISALELDPTVASNTVLLAGHGRYSNFRGIGGPRAGLLRTTNGGATWARLGVAELTGQNISGVAARGSTLVVSSTNGGIWRSTNTGATFAQLSGNGASGLPNAGAFDLVGDPSNNARLYAATTAGIFRSDDTGATWTPVTNGITGIIGGVNGTNNLEMSVAQVGVVNVVYAGVVNAGQLNGLWRSTDQGANWTQLDTPVTNESDGTTIGLQPRQKPGGQGGTNFSILADRTNANLVHLGGDRQPGPFPNSIGANNFTGRLFRCDATLPAGAQCTPLTHNGTSNNSAPHADSREMVFDPNGNIIETDDGGVYRRTLPQTVNGIWTSVNGNLQIAEQQSCQYDNVANLILCGNPDTGVPEQPAGGGSTWDSVSVADGGFIAISDPPGAANSVRYSSSNSLGSGSFRRRTCTAADVCANSAPGFQVVGQPAGTTIQTFEQDTATPPNSTLPLYTPLMMNTVDNNRLVVTSNTRVYESTDRLDNLTIINTLGIGTTRAIAYGGRQSGADNPGVLWFGDSTGGLWLRSGAGGAATRLPGWTNGTTTDIVLDPENWATAYVSTGSAVFQTTDAGLTFTDISGTLSTEAPAAQIWSLEVIPVPGAGGAFALVAGTDAGVFMTNSQNFGAWAELGNNLPNTHAYDITYDAVDDVLLVGTLGRGSWLLRQASLAIPMSNLRVTKTDSPDPVKAGEELFYTVTVTNDGPDTAVGVVAIDDLPDEVIYLENNAGCGYDPLTHRLTCPLGDIPNGESRSFTIKTLVKSDTVVNQTDGTLLITNRVTVGSVSIDTETANNTATAPTFVQDKADLRVSKICKPDGPLPAGQTGTCTIYVDNLGPSSARNIVLTDAHLSDGAFTFGPITASQGTCDPPANGVVRCELGNLAAASPSQTGRITVTIALSANEGVDINDTATVTAATPDPVTTNNQASESINVMAVSDLAVTKSGPSTAVAGTNIVYTLGLTNNGPSTAQGVFIEDDLPTGVQVVSVTGSGGATCNAGVPGNPLRPTTCSFGTVSPTAPGNTRTMTITVRVLPDTRGVLNNDARVTSQTFDGDLSNNLATVTTDATGSADLSITKTDSPDPVLAGNELTYTIKVTNSGPSTADNVTVTDPLPSGTTFVSGVDGNGVTVCTLLQPGTVVCDLGTMDPGSSRTIFLTVLVAPSVPAGAVLTNTASVTSNTPDPNHNNNSATEQTGVQTSADLWLDKTGVQRSGNPSPVVVYTLNVHNNAGCETDAQSTSTPTCGAGGPSDAVNVTVTDKLPLDPKKVVVQYVSPQCTYTKATHTVVCSTSRVPAGASVSFVIEVQVSGSVGTIINSATLSSLTPDPVPANNTNAVTIVVKGGTGKR